MKYWQSNMNNVKMFQAHKEAIREARWINAMQFSVGIGINMLSFPCILGEVVHGFYETLGVMLHILCSIFLFVSSFTQRTMSTIEPWCGIDTLPILRNVDVGSMLYCSEFCCSANVYTYSFYELFVKQD